jgi:ribosomal protein L3 glutamine methyltransferase
LGRQRSPGRLAPRTWTIGRLIQYGARRFRAHGLAFGHGTLNARDEAAYLTLHALNLPPGKPVGRAQRLSPSQAASVKAVFAQRIQERRPAAYLTHEAWLGDFRFYIDERAIIPRSFIAELLREDLAPWIVDSVQIRRALDLCTGSGCLAVLLAHSFTRARIEATDISSAALQVARRNVRAYHLLRRIGLVQSDLFTALGRRRYDLIVCNPPYVRAAIMRRLPREHRSEPALALAGGIDGLDIVHRILRRAWRHLNPGGLIVVEVGHNRPRVERAYPRLAFTWVQTSGGDDCVFLLTREQLRELYHPDDRASAAGSARPRRRGGTSVRA